MDAATVTTTDLDLLRELNDEYIRSVQEGDVLRFHQLLAEDFLYTSSDGSLLDRRAFLEHTAQPVTIANLTAHDVQIRLLGDVAIVHARTTFTYADGRSGASRYTDVWARREGRWQCVAAQVTRY